MRQPGQRLSFIALVGAGLIVSACAPSGRFEFTTSTTEVEAGREVSIEVRLKNLLSYVFVNDAVITATRLDMEPDGMRDVTAPIVPQPTKELGALRFKATFAMTGRWKLHLTAHVPGDPEPTKGSVIITAN
jgi:hypothetical protein